jgi:type IV secretory pathway VirB3-like protein
MSNLTFLVAESFLVLAATLTFMLVGKLAADKSAEIITGVVRGVPVSPRMREGMLWGIWLPWHAFGAAVAAFLALTQLEMANHMTDANVKVVVYFMAFIAAWASALNVVLVSIALFSHLAKVRRDAQRQAEAD